MEKNVSLKRAIDRLFGEIFTNDEITEIVINRYYEIWYEDENGWAKGTPEQCERITKDNVQTFAIAVAASCDQQLDESNSILGTTLPTNERIQFVRPPSVPDGQFSITIRKPMNRSMSLNEYQASGFFDHIIVGEAIRPIDRQLATLLDKKHYKEFFEVAIASGLFNIAIAGATGSGKTTLFKAFMRCIGVDERLITIEDVRELFDDVHQNTVNLLYPSEVTPKENSVTPARLLKSSLRMKPDRILLAELRAGETFDYINAISSGHGGSITTLHAGTKEEVIRRLTLMTLQNPTGSTLPYETARGIIEDTIDIITHVGRINGKRGLTFLYWKDYDKIKAIIHKEALIKKAQKNPLVA